MDIGFVTGNKGKLREISSFMEPLDIVVHREEGPFIEVQADSLDEVIERGMDDLIGRKGKDTHLMKDDSGLFIDALGGFPGVYSAYVQRTIGNRGILRLMEGETDRRARFMTVIGLWIPDSGLSLFRGEVKGEITTRIRGRGGFGFDPIFIPEGFSTTFAEMTLDQKNSMSHRIRAMKGMVDALRDRRGG